MQPLGIRVSVTRRKGTQPGLGPRRHQPDHSDSDFLKAEEDFEPHPWAAFPLTPSLPGAVGTVASRRQEGAGRTATRSSPGG